jgi:hypothetical protein
MRQRAGNPTADRFNDVLADQLGAEWRQLTMKVDRLGGIPNVRVHDASLFNSS